MANKNNSAGILAGLLAGAAVGVVLGVLYAPEDGKNTRKKIKNKATDLAEQANDQYAKTSEKVKEQYQTVSEQVKDKYSNISSQVKDQASNIASSVKEGYDKYKDQMVSKATGVVKDVETELDGMK